MTILYTDENNGLKGSFLDSDDIMRGSDGIPFVFFFFKSVLIEYL